MANQGSVTKIYELRTLGYQDLSKELDNVAKKFEAIKKAKLSTEGKLIGSSDINDVKRYADEINQLKVQEQQLRTQRQQMINEQKTAQIQRQAEINQQKQVASGAKVAAGSYAELYQQYRQLYNLVKNTPQGAAVNFQGQTLGFDQAITKLKSLATAEQSFRRQFAQDGLLVAEYSSGIVQAFKQMGLGDLVGGQITKAQARLKELNGSFEVMREELNAVKATGVGDFAAIETMMVANRKEAIALGQTVNTLKTEFRGTGDVGNQISTSIANGFKNAKTQLAQFVVGYLGFTALISGGQKLIHENSELSDSFAQLQIFLHGTDEDVQHLFESLKKIDTRTSLAGLVDIATIVSKKGVAKEQIAGVTQALDQLFVLLGKEAGDPHEGTASIVKLISIFNDDKHVTAERVNEIGTSLFKLTTTGVATGKFLIDFAERVGSVRGITGLTLPNILGMGAALEQLGQRTEIAGTAAVQLATKMFSNVPKFAEAAGQSVEDFRKLLKDNPFDALVAVAQNLKGGGKDFEEVIQAFGEVGITGARIKTVLADIATNGEFVKQKMAAAAVSTSDYGNQTAAADIKQHTFAANMERVAKQFETIGTSRGFQVVLSAIASLLLALIGNLPILLTFVGLLTISWAAQNLTLIGLRAQVLLYNLGIGANIILINVLRVANIAYTAVMFVLNNAYAIVTKTAALFNLTIGKTPLGLLLTGVGLLISAFKAFGGGINSTSKSLQENIDQARIARDVYREAAKATAEHRAQAQLLVGVVKDLSISEETRLSALKKLIALDPTFQKTLIDGKINYDLLNKSLSAYNDNLQKTAELEAARARQTREVQKLQDLNSQKQDLEFAISSKNFSELDEKTAKLLARKVKDNLGFISLAGPPGKKQFIQAARDLVKDFTSQINEQTGVIDATQQVFNDKLKAIGEKTTTDGNKITGPAGRSIDDINADLKDANARFAASVIGSPEYKELRGKIASLQKELELADPSNKKTTSKASHLTAIQKDDFKDIDAFKDRVLATNEKLRIEDQISEEDYLRNIFQINLSAIDKKLKLLKGSNAEERKVIEQLNLEKEKLEQETDNKIFELRKERLKNDLDEQIKDIQERDRKIQEDVNASPTTKAQSKLDADRAILALQEKFNTDIDALEKELSQHSLKNAKEGADAVRKLKEQIFKDEKEVTLSTLAEIDKATEDAIADIKIKYDKLIQEILKSGKSDSDKKAAIDILVKVENVETTSTQQDANNKKLAAAKVLLDAGLITKKQYEEIYAAAVDGQKKLNDAINAGQKDITTFAGLLGNKLSKLFGFAEGSDKAKVLADTIAQAFNLAKTAMDDYFNNEANNIKRSQDLQIKRLELEKQQSLDRAQSQAEQDSLNKQYAAKEDAVNRAAFEKNKKLQREQAKINLAIQLSNLAVIAFAPNPLNIATLGVAGAILYAVQAAIAITNYALNIGRINSASYGKGGVPSKTGGEIQGPSHAHGGVPFSLEAEGSELAIINKRSAADNRVRTFTGTNKGILSLINELGGGIRFASGARLTKFESGGYIGQNLQAPIFAGASNNTIISSTGISEKKFDELIDVIQKNNDETSKRIDRIQTNVLESDITDAQKKKAKQSLIGTI